MSNPTPALNRAALIDKMARAGLGSKAQAREILDGVIGQISAALRRGETIHLAGFGVFQPKVVAARKSHNIHTGEIVLLPPRRRVVFKPSKALLPQQTETQP